MRKGFFLLGLEVGIFRLDQLDLRRRHVGMSRAFKILANLPEDMFIDERVDEPPEMRDEL